MPKGVSFGPGLMILLNTYINVIFAWLQFLLNHERKVSALLV